MSKRATRYKAEVVDRQGLVVWEVLVHDAPAAALARSLAVAGFDVRRVSPSKVSGPLPLTYSELDPAESIRAAREHATRRETQKGNALLLLLAHAPNWVSRNQVRKVAGDQGDRRVRELRQLNWPVETDQLEKGKAWHVRLNFDNGLKAERPERGDGTLF